MQRVHVKVDVKDNTGAAVAPYPKDFYYWEAWAVTANSTSVHISDGNKDQWQYSITEWKNDKKNDCYKGSIVAEGEAAYYGGVTVAQMSSAGWKQGDLWGSDEVLAHLLLAMKGADHMLGSGLAATTTVVKKSVYYTWDCLPGHAPTWGFSFGWSVP
jgi:hypothetical protein